MAVMLAPNSLARQDDKPLRAEPVVIVPPARDATAAGVRGRTAGSSLFKTWCATCHGLEARGDGPLADDLRVRPPDLTLLGRRNGSFDREKVRRIVDGRNPVDGHGGPDMPVWGDVFKQADEGYSDKKVAERIESLLDYLSSIQRAP
jgi:mono/diheme cytochrome c family protein